MAETQDLQIETVTGSRTFQRVRKFSFRSTNNVLIILYRDDGSSSNFFFTPNKTYTYEASLSKYLPTFLFATVAPSEVIYSF